MDEVFGLNPNSNGSNSGVTVDWWSDAADEDTTSLMQLDASDGGLWSGNFVPPPPRPVFLDEGVTTDGLTTCDLCTWAWQNTNAFTLDAAMEAPGEIGWVLTLVIVSLISAVIGAIIMIVALHCKSRTKQNNQIERGRSRRNSSRSASLQNPIDISGDKTISAITSSTFPNINNNSTNSGVWSWLSRRNAAAPPQLDLPPLSSTENHYTHMDETYGGTSEALYAELDQESTLERESNNSPAYQNSAYADPDAPPSTAPSSAYYSDLSVTTNAPDRTYEVVGLSTMPTWDNFNNGHDGTVKRPTLRLAAINETVTVPSDYV